MQLNIKKFTAAIAALTFFNLTAQSQTTITQAPGVETYLVKKEGVTNANDVFYLTNAEKAKAVTYTDGFGRPIQSILVAASPNGKDIVSFSQYDALGQQPRQYLPYEGSTSTGAYADNAAHITSQATFYHPSGANAKKITGDYYPYSESSFEQSPLQRVLKVGGIGDGFQLNQHYKTLNYRNGTAAEYIRKWSLASGGNATGNVTYGNDDLIVSEVVDENNIHAAVYKDKMGRLILKRQDGAVTGTFNDTYYVYDNLGNIVYIIPPRAVVKMAGLGYNTINVPELIYQFWYDSKNRATQKKVPGAKEMYIVYDPLDRVLFTQDGNMRSSNGTKWAYVKYDNANRTIIQGIYTHGSVQTQSQMQAYVDGLSSYSTTYYEIRQAGTSGYSNQCFPTTNTEERAYSYFDNYDFDFDGTADYSKLAQGLTGEATATDLTYGLATGSKKKILGSGTPGTWITDVSFYDKYYHVIQVRSSNQLDNTVNDHTTNVVTFSGKVKQAKQYKSLSSLTVTVSTRYEYDDMERLTKVRQTNPGTSEVIVASYEYNVLGQLVDKKLHSTNGTDYLQSVDMRYNIRGQLLSINNSARNIDAANNDESNDLFGMEILYDKQDGSLSNTPSYAGMISAIKWSAKTPANPTPGERSFKYTYDNLYRLTASTYNAKANGSSTWTTDQNGFNETLTYDENGNITSLLRKAVLGGTVTTIDNLTYSYKNGDTENQLDNISDAVSTNATGYGYRNYTGSSSGYTYDDNGNLKTDPKKGTTISYNELNKPTQIKNNNNSNQFITYRYDAAGIRLTKYVYNGSNTVPVKTVEYVGGYVVEGGVLSYYGMAEGRVRNDGGGSLNLKMEYFITDHQGNTRISFEDNGTGTNTAVLTQENSYYAFGMQMAGGYTPSNPNKKLYNAGSEWQDDIDGLVEYYSTFYREYDPVIGRFNSVDPMAEATDAITTYAYGNNNPIMMNDPMGDKAEAKPDNAFDRLITAINDYGVDAFAGYTYNFSEDGNDLFWHETGGFEIGQMVYDFFRIGSLTTGEGGPGYVTMEEFAAKFKEIHKSDGSKLKNISGMQATLLEALKTVSGTTAIALTELLAAKNLYIVKLGGASTNIDFKSAKFKSEPGETAPMYSSSGVLLGFWVNFASKGADLGFNVIADGVEILIHELGHVISKIVYIKKLNGGYMDFSNSNYGMTLLANSWDASSRIKNFYQNGQPDGTRIWEETRSVYFENLYRREKGLNLRQYYFSNSKELDLEKWGNYQKIIK